VGFGTDSKLVLHRLPGFEFNNNNDDGDGDFDSVFNVCIGSSVSVSICLVFQCYSGAFFHTKTFKGHMLFL